MHMYKNVLSLRLGEYVNHEAHYWPINSLCKHLLFHLCIPPLWSWGCDSIVAGSRDADRDVDQF